MKVCLVVGSQRARFCGVKDYALRLAEALRELGIEAEVRAPPSWRLGAVMAFRRGLRLGAFDVVHVQYPSIGFRYSPVPMLLGWMGVARCVCVTLHEYRSLAWVQRVALQIFRVTARGIVFTTLAERNQFGSALGRVIGIGSNVEAPAGSSKRREAIVVYFGQIRPEKGLEAFLGLAKLGLGFRFQVLGAGVERHRGYLEGLRAGSAGDVEWILDEELEVVAARMSGALAAYLPFPDGATLKRGSLLGALVCGLPVVTVVSDETPGELAEVVLAAKTAEEAQKCLAMLKDEPEWAAEMSERGRKFAERFSWPAIAAAHVRFYEEMLVRQ